MITIAILKKKKKKKSVNGLLMLFITGVYVIYLLAYIITHIDLIVH